MSPIRQVWTDKIKTLFAEQIKRQVCVCGKVTNIKMGSKKAEHGKKVHETSGMNN